MCPPECDNSGKPDWGHGPNKPVPRWNEDEIRAVMTDVMPRLGDEVVIELVLNKLKEKRR